MIQKCGTKFLLNLTNAHHNLPSISADPSRVFLLNRSKLIRERENYMWKQQLNFWRQNYKQKFFTQFESVDEENLNSVVMLRSKCEPSQFRGAEEKQKVYSLLATYA